MNKAQLIQELASRFDGNRKQAQAALDHVLDTITRQIVKGERVVITGFGAFEKVDRPARTARNPRTGERVKVKKTSVPKFKPGAELKSYVNGSKKLAKVAASAAGKAASGTTKRATKATGTAGAASTRKSAAASPAKAATTRKAAGTSKRAAGTTTTRKTAAKRTTKRAAKS